MNEEIKNFLWKIFWCLVGVIILFAVTFGIVIYEMNTKIDKKIESVNSSLSYEIGRLENDISMINKRFESLDFTEDNSEKVYITKTGEKYHFEESCVVHPIESTLNKAVAKGFTPCKKCAE